MGNELSRISDNISNFLIDDYFKIDDTLEWYDLVQVYIMRYRRIIGIFILIILIGIMNYCNWQDKYEKDDVPQIGGGGNHAAAVAAEMAKLRATDEAQQQFAKEKAERAKSDAKILANQSKAEQAAKLEEAKAAKKASKSTFSKGMSEVGTRIKSTKVGQSVSKAAESISSKGKAAGENLRRLGSHLSKDTYTGAQVAKLGKGVSSTLGKSKLGQLATGKLGDIKAMRSAGMSKFGVAKELAGQAGQYAADKFKEFAGWLYEILFALAISIAICMIVVPSIAFFALGLICYFLLRKKISTMKAF
jgi:hypothetical protein